MGTYYIKNKTNKYISIGDLPKLPNLSPNAIEDGLKFYNAKELNQSANLKNLVNKGWIQSPRSNNQSNDALSVSLPVIEKTASHSSNIGSLSQTFGYQISNYNIPDVWTQTQGEGIRVGVIDTGVDAKHEDLQKRLFNPNDPSIVDGNSHGTHVAGTIAANNNAKGIVGIAPKATIYANKVLSDSGGGSDYSVSRGIREAVANKCDIINLSLGAPVDLPQTREAIKHAYNNNVIVICAAGNSGQLDHVIYPAFYKETISVGALNSSNIRAWFSTGGANLDFMAPGVSILSTVPNNGYAKYSGTSMATPWLAGIAALILSKHRKYGGSTPVDNVEQMREHIKRLAIDLGQPGWDKETGFGIINVKEAFKDLKPIVVIGSTQLNAPGKELSNLENEWVEFKNIGNKEADMTNWYFEDLAGWKFEFPSGFKLQPNKSVKVVTGVGEDTDNKLYWGYKRAIWNNEGDSVMLYNENDSLVLKEDLL